MYGFIDRVLSEAAARGEFDNLPNAGLPRRIPSRRRMGGSRQKILKDNQIVSLLKKAPATAEDRTEWRTRIESTLRDIEQWAKIKLVYHESERFTLSVEKMWLT